MPTDGRHRFSRGLAAKRPRATAPHTIHRQGRSASGPLVLRLQILQAARLLSDSLPPPCVCRWHVRRGGRRQQRTALRKGRPWSEPSVEHLDVDNWLSRSSADLVFDPTPACRRRAGLTPASASLHPPPRIGETGRQDLLLSRTMISNNELPYVGRFACDWHRLATTDLRSVP